MEEEDSLPSTSFDEMSFIPFELTDKDSYDSSAYLHLISPLYIAVMRGLDDEALSLLESGGAVNLDKVHGITVLHLASGMIMKKVVDKILEQDIDVNVLDSWGSTALHAISKAEPVVCMNPRRAYKDRNFKQTQKKITLKLLSKGADVNICNMFGDTPLLCASDKRLVDIVKILLEHGADTNVKNGNGDTALLVVIKVLVAVKGSTCLMIHQDCMEIATLLLEYGSDPNATDEEGYTALQYIVEHNKKFTRYLFTNLLIWGGSLFTMNDMDERLLDELVSPTNYNYMLRKLVEYVIVLKCANLNCSKYAVVESTLLFETLTEKYVLRNLNVMEKLKQTKCGPSYTLYNVFDSYSDPLYVLDGKVERYVRETWFYLNHFNYGSLLKHTFSLAQKRYKMLIQAHDKLLPELPNEVVWKILTYLEDEDLELLVTAGLG